MIRLVVAALALSLALTGAGYVRRAPLRVRQHVVTVVGGSRDRHLHGKTRIRARRSA